MDELLLDGFLKSWVAQNPALIKGAVSKVSLISVVQGIVVFDCVNLYADYQMKYLNDGLGTYADKFLKKIEPDILKFKRERRNDPLTLKWKFIHANDVYCVTRLYM